MRGSLGTAAGLGAVSGLRTMLGAAAVARELSSRTGHGHRLMRCRGGSLARWMSRGTVARTLELLALGELIADKLPGVPDRIAPGPLVARAGIGGALGSIAGAGHRPAAALIGAGSAVAAAFAGWWVRREAARATHLPDVAVAVAEDALALAAGRRLAVRI